VACLEYNKISWDNFDLASSDGIEWKDLTSVQKDAAVFLGYDSKDWAKLQARKKSTITTTENNSNNKAEEENSGSSNGGRTRTKKKQMSNCAGKTGSGKRNKNSLVRYVGPMENEDSMKVNTFVSLPRGDDNDVDKPFLLAKRKENKLLGYLLKEEKYGQMYECPYCDTYYQRQGFTNHVKHCKKT
jgi:hypothetical protein